MNWIDIVLLILLVAAIIVGSKKGLIRELMALAVLTATVIVSVNYIDIIAVKIYETLGGSPLVTAIISFVVLLAVIYAVFKLLGILFYKVANLQKLRRERDNRKVEEALSKLHRSGGHSDYQRRKR